MKKPLLLSKLLTENTYSTHEIDVHGFTHVFAYPDPKGHETMEGLDGWEANDRANREVHFVKNAAEALAMAKSYPVNENDEMPITGRRARRYNRTIGSVDVEDLEDAVEHLYGEDGLRAVSDFTWAGDGPVNPFTFISRAFRACDAGDYPTSMLANIVFQFVKLSGGSVNEGPLSGRVGDYDYQNPRSQKDVEDFERKGYVRIDKRTPSFRYKDDAGDYTPMYKKLER